MRARVVVSVACGVWLFASVAIAEESVGDFNDKYAPLTRNLTDLVAKYDDNAEFYEYVRKVKATRAGLDPITQRLVMSVLNDKTLLKTFADQAAIAIGVRTEKERTAAREGPWRVATRRACWAPAPPGVKGTMLAIACTLITSITLPIEPRRPKASRKNQKAAKRKSQPIRCQAKTSRM